jgi:HD-like signal output (HDOD) protein
MSDELIRTRIKRLPPFPLVAHRLIELMQQENCSAAKVTDVLSADQALAGKILKIANSSFYGMSGKVATVSRAVVILGFSAIRSMALGLGLTRVLKSAADGESLLGFWNHAIYVGAGCRTLARQAGHLAPEEAFVTGLLHDLGHLILEMHEPGYCAELNGFSPADVLAVETERFGLSHTKAGQMALRHWHLPERLASVLRFHHHQTQWRSDDSSLLATVQLAELIACALGQSTEKFSDPPDPAALARHIGLSLGQTSELLTATCQEVTIARDFLEISGVDVSTLTPCGPTGPPVERGRAVYLGGDRDRAGWLLGQLAIHGWQPLAMDDYLADAALVADLAVVDPRTLKDHQAAKLAAVLRSRGAMVVLASDDDAATTHFPDAPVLPPALAASVLDELLASVPHAG